MTPQALGVQVISKNTLHDDPKWRSLTVIGEQEHEHDEWIRELVLWQFQVVATRLTLTPKWAYWIEAWLSDAVAGLYQNAMTQAIRILGANPELCSAMATCVAMKVYPPLDLLESFGTPEQRELLRHCGGARRTYRW